MLRGMTSHLVLEALRVLVAGYLLVLVGAALLGFHRALLTYPFQSAYATVRLFLLTVTLGRVKLVKNARKSRRRQARRLRDLRYNISEWRESRSSSSPDEGAQRVRGEWMAGDEDDGGFEGLLPPQPISEEMMLEPEKPASAATAPDEKPALVPAPTTTPAPAPAPAPKDGPFLEPLDDDDEGPPSLY